MEHNLAVYNHYVHEYQDYRLYPPERAILQHFKARWPQIRMLDVGIGTGRTTFTFAAVAGQYVGIDYAAEMVRQSKAIVREDAGVVLQQCDARDLSQFYAAPFDFAMFSMNGLDSVGHDDRERVLKEVRKVLKPDGYFFFSTHLLSSFSVDRPLPTLRPSLRAGYFWTKAMLHRRRLRRAHRGTALDEVRKRPWAVLKTGDHGFEIDIYHVDAQHQLDELARLGLRVETVLDPDGAAVDATQSKADWLYFLCRPV